MGFLDQLRRFFSTNSETNDNHLDDTLMTHYYKSTKDKVLDEIKDLIQHENGYSITSISQEYGEITVQMNKKKKAFLVFTVIMVKPFRTAVDLTVSTETAFFTDFGFSRKVIYDLYDKLDKRLEFVGTGLGDELTQ